MNCYCLYITIPRGVLEKTNEKSLDILYNLCIKNNLFVRAYKLYPKYRREEDMTDNGKPKYFSLMEQLRNDIVSGVIRPGEMPPHIRPVPEFPVLYGLYACSGNISEKVRFLKEAFLPAG